MQPAVGIRDKQQFNGVERIGQVGQPLADLRDGFIPLRDRHRAVHVVFRPVGGIFRPLGRLRGGVEVPCHCFGFFTQDGHAVQGEGLELPRRRHRPLLQEFADCFHDLRHVLHLVLNVG